MIGRVARAAARRARGLLPGRPRPVILMYHRVAEESFDPWGLAVSPARFAEQLHWLAGKRTILPLTRFAAMHADGTLSADAIALTFDDAYECAAEIAAPLLDQLGLPATIFLPADLIERGGPFWWDELQQLVLGHEGDRLKYGNEEFILGPTHPNDRRWESHSRPRTGRQAAFLRIWAALREEPPSRQDEAIERLRCQVRMAEASDVPRPMNAAQVRGTASELIEFGSHALTHPWLASLTNAEKSREIRGSIDRVERLSGRFPTTFAYPYGNFDEESERIVEEAGFTCACATLGHAVAPESGLFALPRVQVGDWSSGRLARVLAAA